MSRRNPTKARPLGARPASGEFAAQARRVGRHRWVANALVVAAIAVVTLWTGLTALYFGKPFGAATDYISILVWGFGAQAGLTALATALDGILAGRAPL